MCVSMKYNSNNRLITVKPDGRYGVSLPVIKKNSGTSLITWGRAETCTGNLPLGYGICLDDIKSRKLDTYLPQPIRLAVCAFALQKPSGRIVWFELNKRDVLQGALLSKGQEQRCYVVYLKSYKPCKDFDAWPRVIGHTEQLALDVSVDKNI